MATRLYLVRHGATPPTAENRFSGAENVDLSDEGRRQVSLLAERLAGHKISIAYSSSMSRAVETAAILCRPLGLRATPPDGLRAIDDGPWGWLTRAEGVAK